MPCETRVAAQTPSPCSAAHVVQFYEEDDYLCEMVADYALAGIDDESPVLVLASEGHQRSIAAKLTGKGCSVLDAVRSGHLLMLDSAVVLARIRPSGRVDSERFAQVAGAILEQRIKAVPGKQLRLYGEIVDILWNEGKHDECLALEALWNQLEQRFNFSCFCSYRSSKSDGFDVATQRAVQQICDLHSHVLPSQGGQPERSLGDRAERVHSLEQQLRTLSSKLVEQKEVEHRLRAALRACEERFVTANAELRSPLTRLKHYLDALAQETDGLGPPLSLQHLAEIAHHLNRMATVADDYLMPLAGMHEVRMRNAPRPNRA